MVEMTLTKVQKEILTILKNVPGTQVVNPAYRASYLEKDGERIKIINSPNFDVIEPYLKSVEAKGHYRYIFDPEAEITDEWPARKREIKNERREAEKAVEQAQVKAEADKAAAWFEATGPYTVEFPSENYFSGSGDILFNGEFVSSFRGVYSSSDGRTFEAMLKRPQNLEQFSRIKEMLRRANGVEK